MFLESMARGFGWGLGFGIAILLIGLVYQHLYVSDTEKAAQAVIEKVDRKNNDPRDLTPEESMQVKATISDIDIFDGKIVMRGVIENGTELRIKRASISIPVHNKQFLIERCVGILDGPLEPRSSGTISSICRETWKDIEITDLSGKPIVGQVWL